MNLPHMCHMVSSYKSLQGIYPSFQGIYHFREFIHSSYMCSYDQHLLDMLHMSGTNLSIGIGRWTSTQGPYPGGAYTPRGMEAGSDDSIPAGETKTLRGHFPDFLVAWVRLWSRFHPDVPIPLAGFESQSEDHEVDAMFLLFLTEFLGTLQPL